jgi:hypothetical protein
MQAAHLITPTRPGGWSRLLATGCAALVLAGIPSAGAQQSPLLIRSAVTTTLDPSGRPWAYVVLNQNAPGLLTNRTLAVYQKNSLPDSPGSFVFRGLIAPGTDPTSIGVLLNRAVSVGDNTVALDTQLTALHRLLINQIDSITPPTNDPPVLALNRRLSAILARSAGDTVLTQTLDLLGLGHPAVRLVRGTAWAGPLQVPVGSDVTLEIRERDATGTDSAVISRVSLKAGQPDLLPAPGPLVVVPDATSRGDLAIELRWATPDALRMAGLKHNGDLVWRVSKSFAEGHGFQLAPPAGATLDALALSNPTDVKRVGGPIFPPKLFSAVDVGDFVGDATSVFLTDNNDRYAAGGTPMAEGAQAYYFVAGADALGRPGLVSPGVLATFCARVPPHVPTRLSVKPTGPPGGLQVFDVSWLTTVPGDGTSTTRYEVFRGNDLAYHAAAQQGTLNLNAPPPIVAGLPDAIKRIAVIGDPNVNPSQLLHVLDDVNGSTSPWWYAIRAVHAAPPGCPDLFSALGPPAFGALHVRSAPPAPDNSAISPPPVQCLRVACMSDVAPTNVVSPDPLDQSVLHFTVQCSRRNRGIAAAHIQVLDGFAIVVPETVLVFPEIEESASPAQDVVEYSFTYPLASQSHTIFAKCRSEAVGGALSAWANSSATGVLPTGNVSKQFHFMAGAISELERQQALGDPLWSTLGPPGPGECVNGSDVHLAFSPESGLIFSPSLCFPLAPNAAQYRVYRRVDDGPLTLIAQGLQSYTPGASVCETDKAPPTSNGRVFYFAQLLDGNGHASAMRRLGSLRFTGYKPPTPVLFSPKPADFGGTAAAPTITISWACPPEHVNRFEVFFAASNQSTAGSGISEFQNRLTRIPAKYPTMHKITNKLEPSRKLLVRVDESFLTGPVGGNIGAGPLFSVTLNVNPNFSYKIWLRSVGPGGEVSDDSRHIEVSWLPSPGPAPSIAWPARPLPPVAAFNPGIMAVDFSDIPVTQRQWDFQSDAVLINQTPVGIRVGSVTAFESSQHFYSFTNHGYGNDGEGLATSSGSTIAGRADPNTQFYSNPSDPTQILPPFVLYRQQVANAAYPAVSGNVIQASPLISKVAWRVFAPPAGVATGAELVDPFFRWLRNDPDENTHSTDLYVLDTQPVVIGARYRYWLTRFNNLGEPIQTIPCGEVTIETGQ